MLKLTIKNSRIISLKLISSWTEIRRYGKPTISASSCRIRSKFSPMWRGHSSTSIMSGHMFLYIYLLLAPAASSDLIFRSIEKSCSCNDIKDHPSTHFYRFYRREFTKCIAKVPYDNHNASKGLAQPMYLEHIVKTLFPSLQAEKSGLFISLTSSFDCQFQTHLLIRLGTSIPTAARDHANNCIDSAFQLLAAVIKACHELKNMRCHLMLLMDSVQTSPSLHNVHVQSKPACLVNQFSGRWTGHGPHSKYFYLIMIRFTDLNVEQQYLHWQSNLRRKLRKNQQSIAQFARVHNTNLTIIFSKYWVH